MIPAIPITTSSRQAIYLAVGLAPMVALSRVDYARLRHLMYPIYGALILSILAVLALGRDQGLGALTRAISFPLFSFQASELGKVLLIVALSAFVVGRSRRLRELDTTARVLLVALVPAMLVILQPDLGSGLVYMAIAFMLLFVAGTSWRQLVGLVALVVVSGTVVLVAAPAIGVHVLKPYQEERLTAFLNPFEDSPGEEGLPAVAVEGRDRLRPEDGPRRESTQIEGKYVPEDDTDFVFAAVGEQYGFVGAALVLSPVRAADMAHAADPHDVQDLFGSLVAAGVLAMLMFQVFVNVGMSWDNADHRRHATSHELWRIVGHQNPSGCRSLHSIYVQDAPPKPEGPRCPPLEKNVGRPPHQPAKATP